jgi:hypothetical protein
MSRTFKTVDYAQALDLTVRLGDCLPPDHLARFVVDSVALLELETEGIVGHVAETHYGFGFTDNPHELLLPGHKIGTVLAS